MIGWLAKIFLGANSWMSWLALVVVVGGLFGGVWYNGYSTASNKWELKYEQRERQIAQTTAIEQDRQWEANQRAKERERAMLDKLLLVQDELDKQLGVNANEAANDPDRDRIGISVDGVQRINRIK